VNLDDQRVLDWAVCIVGEGRNDPGLDRPAVGSRDIEVDRFDERNLIQKVAVGIGDGDEIAVPGPTFEFEGAVDPATGHDKFLSEVTWDAVLPSMVAENTCVSPRAEARKKTVSSSCQRGEPSFEPATSLMPASLQLRSEAEVRFVRSLPSTFTIQMLS
jgi:hypothetical protein